MKTLNEIKETINKGVSISIEVRTKYSTETVYFRKIWDSKWFEITKDFGSSFDYDDETKFYNAVKRQLKKQLS